MVALWCICAVIISTYIVNLMSDEKYTRRCQISDVCILQNLQVLLTLEVQINFNNTCNCNNPA